MNWYKTANDFNTKLYVGSDEELLAKFPERLSTEKLLEAIKQSKKMLVDIEDSESRIGPMQIIKDLVNESINNWQQIIDSRSTGKI